MDSEMGGQKYELKAVNPVKLAFSWHKRSQSDGENRVKDDILEPPSASSNMKRDTEKGEAHIDMKRLLPDTKVQDKLKQEIMQLEKRLNDQLVERQELEKALGYRTSVIDSSSDSFMPTPAKDLIREISLLELEVMHLEHYLLSLYRKAFDQQIPSLSPVPPKSELKEPISCQRKLYHVPGPEISSKDSPLVQSTRILPSQMPAYKLVDESVCEDLAHPGVQRCHSALNERTVYSSRFTPSEEALARALQEVHSQPLSFLTHDTSVGMISLAEYLGTTIADHVPETPNKISEDMVRCMGSIYSKVADPPLVIHGPASSPASSFSSLSAISPQYIGDMWSPGCRNESTIDTRLVNPFRVEGLKEFSGPYNAMVEVPSIIRDYGRLKIVEGLHNTYRSLVYKLATANVRKMNNEEKLAFWINLHNALVMHTYLVHGIPQSGMKRTSLLIKATCTVGGHSISANMIQSSFLGCRAHCSGQWLQTLMLPRKLKANDERRRAYAIEQEEPLLYFALCSGSHSDPAVRIYTAKRLHQQLETAKEEYIRATVGIQKEQKILLPKLIESYAKQSCLSTKQVVDLIQRHLPETMRIAVQRCLRGRSQKIIEWVPHNFDFRYLLSREVANPQLI